MHKFATVFLTVVLISVNVRGQLNVAGEGEEVSSGVAVDYDNDKLFDELPSLRIAREYLRRKIAAERRMEKFDENI